MAYQYTVNQQPTTGDAFMYLLKTALLAAGWWLKGNGRTGSSFNNVADHVNASTTDLITSGALMATTNCWFRLKHPTENREFLFHRFSDSRRWRIKFTPDVGFFSTPVTAVSATVPPIATDQIFIAGGGTEASPSFDYILYLDGLYTANIIVDNASPYGWVYVTWSPAVTTVTIDGGFYDPVTDFTPGDLAPYALYCEKSDIAGFRGNASGLDFTNENDVSAPQSFMNNILTASAKVLPVSDIFLGCSEMITPNAVGGNGFDQGDAEIPCFYARRVGVANGGWKGVSSLMRWVGTGRNTGVTHTITTPHDRIIVGDISLPWNGSLPLL